MVGGAIEQNLGHSPSKSAEGDSHDLEDKAREHQGMALTERR